ncbi:NAD-dependent epimerase/dehydratase family protein [Dyella tabacisoli]|uniref:NAD-dependent epimerase/dehydratase family protein n=1 Tax=Dyella tabacisoli TaxID=2282381 RepID=A0A369UN26_9GAMM|nr:NAD-dependent epimerase/dehydratase family protein [Dyella tabacisoli]RDD81475.1 NAD-dependent epimerase/dehydratase family protein [Dyella tabacisoli]
MHQAKKLIVGAGPTGMLTAQALAAEGDEVIIVSRNPRPTLPGIHHVAVDATDVAALTKLAGGVSTIFNCAMPRYDRWPQEFPPIAAAVLRAAEVSGADLVTLSNVYGYGQVAGPMTESLPMAPQTVKGRVRATMWEDALASRARVTEVRASDYLGRDALSLYTLMTLPGVISGQPTHFLGDLDALHSWTYTRDVARTLISASRADGAWGRAWHAPSNDLSVRALSIRIAEIAAAPPPILTRLSTDEWQALAASDPIAREVIEMAYLYDLPCVLDSAATEQALGVKATPIDDVIRDALGR